MKQRSIFSRIPTIAVLCSLMLAGSTRAASVDQTGVKAARSACRDDLRRVCGGVRPGGGRIKDCLREHEAELSSACHQALEEAGVLNSAERGPAQGK